MPAQQSVWTRKEQILAFDLPCKVRFGQIHRQNRRVILLAQLLQRSVRSVLMKLSNLARLGPALPVRGIRGMSHGAKSGVRTCDRVQILIDSKPSENGQKLVDAQDLQIEKMEEGIDAMRPKTEAHFRRLIAGQ
jgi:putative restriction endonuclease